MKDRKLHITLRKLPHWTIEDSVYFITFSMNEGTLSNTEKGIVYNHILSGHGSYYDLLTFVVMKDHIHAVFNLLNDLELSRVMKGIKGVSSHLINQSRGTTGNNWIDESFDRIIRDEEELNNAIEYIFRNPVKAGLVEDRSKYRFYYINENWSLEN